ncbi:MAG: hypothetical protein CSH36_08180, partial [Thalassolituus sp.]
HVDLIRMAMDRLASGGTLIFSNNLRKFALDRDALAEFDIKDVSGKSIPKDFDRRQNIHVCFEISHRT